MYAAMYDSKEELLFLKEKFSFLLNKKNKNGATALMITAANNNIVCAKFLVDEAGYQDKAGWTALMFAIKEGYIDFIDVLWEKEGHIKTYTGENPLLIAVRYHQLECLKDPRL